MAHNARSKVQDLRINRGITPAAGGGGGAYYRPNIVVQPDNQYLRIANALSGLSPSLAAFSERAVQAGYNQDEAANQELVTGLNPEEARSASMKEWRDLEAENPDLVGASPYRRLNLLDSLGRRTAREVYKTNLNSNRLRITDPLSNEDPEDFLASSTEEATQGMGFYARQGFFKEKEGIDARWRQEVQGETRTRLIDAQFKTTRAELNNEVKDRLEGGQGLSPEVITGIQDRHHSVTSDSGRELFLEALTTQTVNFVRNSDDPLEAALDATAMLVEAGQMEDVSGQPFGDLFAGELDALQSRLEDVGRATSNARVNQDAVRQSVAAPKIKEAIKTAQMNGDSKEDLAKVLNGIYQEEGVSPTLNTDLDTFITQNRRIESTVTTDPELFKNLTKHKLEGTLTLEMVDAAAEGGNISYTDHRSFIEEALNESRPASVLAESDSMIDQAMENLGIDKNNLTWTTPAGRDAITKLGQQTRSALRRGMNQALKVSGLTSTVDRSSFKADWMVTEGQRIVAEARTQNNELLNQVASSKTAASQMIAADNVVRRGFEAARARIKSQIFTAIGIDEPDPVNPLSSEAEAMLADIISDSEKLWESFLANDLENTPGRAMPIRREIWLDETFADWDNRIIDQLAAKPSEFLEDRPDLSNKAAVFREQVMKDRAPVGTIPVSEEQRANEPIPGGYLSPQEFGKSMTLLREFSQFTDADVKADPEAFARTQQDLAERIADTETYLSDALMGFAQDHRTVGQRFQAVTKGVGTNGGPILSTGPGGFVIKASQEGQGSNRIFAIQAQKLTKEAIFIRSKSGFTLREMQDQKIYIKGSVPASTPNAEAKEFSFSVDPNRFNPRTALLYRSRAELNAATEADHRTRLALIPKRLQPDSIKAFEDMQLALAIKYFGPEKEKIKP
jgi:polyhydroxyalkanoate synthesis regulator phasin